MKKILCYIFIITAIGFGQNLSVVGTEHISLGKNGDFSFPQFSPDGSKILFTRSNFKGLWLYDLNDKSVVKLNDYWGAGYKPIFSKDGSKIIFRSYEYDKMKKYSSICIQDLSTKQEQWLEKNIRNLSVPISTSDDKIIYKKDENMNYYNFKSESKVNGDSTIDVAAYIENSKIVIYENGEKKSLSPLGEGQYIWLSISPDKSKLLFTLAGRGTFITDLNGNALIELGYANAPMWSPDGNWVVYMVDEDDGYRITASDIYAVSSDGKEKVQLTNTQNTIEMHPNWSPSMDKIVFDTIEGNIMLIEVKIAE